MYKYFTSTLFLYLLKRSRSKAVVPVLLFVASWFILRGDLFYVLPCVILLLCFFSPFSIAITSLGEERELILVLFVRLFDLCLFGFVGFLFLLVSGKGFGLWHSLDFSLTFVWQSTYISDIFWCVRVFYLHLQDEYPNRSNSEQLSL